MRARALGLIVATMLTASCGTKELDVQDFVAQIEAACRHANQRLSALPPPPSPGPGAAQGMSDLAGYLASALEVNREAADGIRALRGPDRLRAPRDRLVEAMDEANDGLAEAAAAATENDEDAFARALEKVQDGRDRFDSAAGALGADECRSAGSAPPSP